MQLSIFYSILRAALGLSTGDVSKADIAKLTPDDCMCLFQMAKKQTLLGVVYDGMKIMEVAIPRELSLNWFMRVEAIRGYNNQMNSVAARLTSLFENQGCKSAVLKGQANARLYPNPEARQPGDIDIWVSGGKASVLKMLKKLGVMKNATVSDIHAHLAKECFGLDVEVHFVPCGCNYNPFADSHMQKFLCDEIEKAELVPEGFCVPSIRFALVMQLSHIRRHFLGLGIGLRQLMDYFILIQNSTEEDREAVGKMLPCMGLVHIASAVMHVLHEVLGLEEGKMLCKPDIRRGEVLLREILDDGNFGARSSRAKGSVYMWWFKNRLRILRLLRFDFVETLWLLVRYWGKFVFLIPTRIAILRNFLLRRQKNRT